MSLRMAWTRFSPAGVSRYSLIALPPKLIGGYSPFLTTSPLAAWNSEPTEMPRASHSRISEATEMLVRSLSSLERNPLVRPLCSATSAMLLRDACLAARSCAPIRGPASGPSCTPAISIAPPFPVIHLWDTRTRHETSVDIHETSRHSHV